MSLTSFRFFSPFCQVPPITSSLWVPSASSTLNLGISSLSSPFFASPLFGFISTHLSMHCTQARIYSSPSKSCPVLTSRLAIYPSRHATEFPSFLTFVPYPLFTSFSPEAPFFLATQKAHFSFSYFSVATCSLMHFALIMLVLLWVRPICPCLPIKGWTSLLPKTPLLVVLTPKSKFLKERVPPFSLPPPFGSLSPPNLLLERSRLPI